MDELYLDILKEIGITNLDDMDGILLERDIFMNLETYERIKLRIVDLKKYFSSSLLTSLQENGPVKQKFPLINIIRQLLKIRHYQMEPIRKANGYEKSGKRQKLYKRYFLIKKIPS